ncbi:MAG: FadR family transcriptional regulator [Actinobacteria bacterium]|nr:FadR family transcriptional regulator [Actinomycetota bacterium]
MTRLGNDDTLGGSPSGRILEGRLRPVERAASVSRRSRARKSYEQVADQLRELIVIGCLTRDERLPNETQLAAEFGVSRATVREALRLLAAQNLIRTAKGAGGGSYVTLPTLDHLSDYMSSNISLLTDARDLTLEELIETRMLLEVPAARLAARRRKEPDLERLREAIPPDTPALGPQQEYAVNSDFHTRLIETCGNRLLLIATRPLFEALTTHLQRSRLSRDFHLALHAQHRVITEAIAEGDEDGAASEMESHLEFLVPHYETAWRELRL